MRLLFMVFLAVLSHGCVTTVPQKSGEAIAAPISDPSKEETPTQTDAPALELDQALIYDFLLSNMAARRGRIAEALEATVRMARRTREGSLVIRAFSLAMRARKAEIAEEMATLLNEVSPGIRARFALVQVYVAQGRRDDAITLVRQMLAEEGAPSARIFNSTAELFSSREDMAEFVPLFADLVADFPDDADGFYALAFLANRAKRKPVLEEAINRALELAPDWEQAALVKFAYYASDKQPEDMQAFVEAFLRRAPDAIQLRERYARYLAAHDILEKSYRQFARVVRDDPDNQDSLLAAALVSMELDKNIRADRLFRRHLENNPANDQTRIYLGQVASRRELWNEAINWYSTVYQDQHYFDAQIRIANVMLKSGDGDSALQHLYELIPSSTQEEVRIYLAQERILREMDRLEDARELLDAAVQEVPDNGDLLYARGLLAAELHLLEMHEADIRRVLQLEPENAHAYNALGYTLADQTDRYDEALELIVKALHLLPNDPFILDSMGWVQFRLGNLEKAEQYLRRAYEIRPDAEIAAHLGEVVWTSGRQAEAEKLWSEALKLDAENPTLLKTLERLRQ